jgi:hypothetical protein
MERVQRVLASERLQAELCDVSVSSEVEAARLNFPGSPTIRVDGEDVERGATNTFGLACRLYADGNGVPSEDTLRSAVLRASRARRMA